MFTNRLAATALALIVIVAAGGFVFSRFSSNGQGGPRATATPVPSSSPAATLVPTPTVAPTPSPVALDATASDGTLAPGTYRVTGFAFPFNVTLPAGWVNQGYKPNSFALRSGNSFLALVVVRSVYADPCHTETAPGKVAAGVDALLAALSKMKGFTVTGVADAVVSGAAAKSFTLSNAIDLQKAGCSSQQVLWIGRDGDDDPVLETPGGADQLWIVDTSAAMSPGTTVLIGGPADLVETIDWRPGLH
jgi:hypothetical protein